ncbi:MAG: sugar transferase [Elusimicrobia bacterium]|nr:sugar transferase [Elusimicrobiota bacterium]
MAIPAPHAVAPPPDRRPASSIRLPLWLRHGSRTALHLALDAAAVAAAYRLAYLWRFRSERWVAAFPIPGRVPGWELYGQMLYAVVPLWLMIFWYSARLYDAPWISGADRFLKIVKGCLLATVATMAATYVYSRLEYSRMMLAMVLPLSAGLVCLSQALVLWVDGWVSRREAALPALLVGKGAVAKIVKERIRDRHPGAEILELPELPPKAELERLLAGRPFYELILFNSSLAHGRILEAAELCDAHGIAFKMLPDLLELRLGEVQMDHSLGLPAYRIQHASLTAANFAAKRAFDLFFCLLVFLVAGLPWLLAALLIRLDSKGPALYKQKRYGYKSRIFYAYKFRTMVQDAESRVAAVKAAHGPQGAFFKAKDDPRITLVGKWLRRFSLDEFPQFINVLKGEMSVVGPRPLALTTGEVEALQRDFGETAKKRMNALPGITGLWQVSGRSDVASDQRFALDMFYIEHWSLGLDLEIILKTIPAMIMAKGAY